MVAGGRPRMWEVLTWSTWFGLLTGFGVVVLHGLKKFVFGQVTIVTPQIIWISPVIFVVVALLLGLALALLGHVAPKVFDVRVTVFSLAAAGSASGLLTWDTELHDLAVILLSLGIGIQFGQFARSKPALFGKLIRWTMPALVALPILMAIGLNVGNAVRERRAVSGLADARPGAPNVLLVILDTVRQISTGLAGPDQPGRPTTPNLNRFAESGITYDFAISPTSWTLPTHASIFTGRPVSDLSTTWRDPLDDTWPTLAEYLTEHGYRTGGVVGNVFYCNSEWGLDRGFIYWKDFAMSLGHGLGGTFIGSRLIKELEALGLEERFWFHRVNGRRIAPDVGRDMVDWIDGDTEHPWFAFVNFYDAHDPYVAPSEYIEQIDAMPHADSLPVKRIEDGALQDAEPEFRRERLSALRDYEASIRYLDAQVGRMLSELATRGLLDNTLVIITSDHGEEFNEHGRGWHGNTLYMPAIHVPLVIRLPDGNRAGERIGTPVSLTDLAATVVDVLGLSDGSPFPGRSVLAPAIDAEGRPPVYAELTRDDRMSQPTELLLGSMVDDELHYILSDEGREELFRYRRDAFEQNDLMGTDSTLASSYRSMLEGRIRP